MTPFRAYLELCGPYLFPVTMTPEHQIHQIEDWVTVLRRMKLVSDSKIEVYTHYSKGEMKVVSLRTPIGEELAVGFENGTGVAGSVVDLLLIVRNEGLEQINDSDALDSVCTLVIETNSNQAAMARAGNEEVIGFFIGQAMKLTRNKANPGMINQIFRKKLIGSTQMVGPIFTRKHED